MSDFLKPSVLKASRKVLRIIAKYRGVEIHWWWSNHRIRKELLCNLRGELPR